MMTTKPIVSFRFNFLSILAYNSKYTRDTVLKLLLELSDSLSDLLKILVGLKKAVEKSIRTAFVLPESRINARTMRVEKCGLLQFFETRKFPPKKGKIYIT